MSQYYECFNCESTFRQEDSLEAGTPSEYCTQYCSEDCQKEFESAAIAAGAAARDAGLCDIEGNAIRGTSATNAALNLLERYKIKVTP